MQEIANWNIEEEINNSDQNDQLIMNQEEISSRVKSLLDEISKLSSELDELRSECLHKETSIKQIQTGGISALRKVCDTCKSVVGYPSPKEIEEWKNT